MHALAERTATSAPSVQQPKLLDRMVAAIRVKHYSLATERTYVHWVKRFIFFHGKRHPADMGAAEVEAFLSALATELEVSASTQNQAMHAILFLYKEVLDVRLPWLDGITRAKVSKRLPSVLTVVEVQALLRHVSCTNGLIIRLLYGTGMRIKECLRLRVKDVDLDTNRNPCAKLLIYQRAAWAMGGMRGGRGGSFCPLQAPLRPLPYPGQRRRAGAAGPDQMRTRWRNQPKTKRSSFSRRSASSM